MTSRLADPVRVLGRADDEQAADWLRGRVVTPGEVEAVALQRYDWRRHPHQRDSYWVTVSDAEQT